MCAVTFLSLRLYLLLVLPITASLFPAQLKSSGQEFVWKLNPWKKYTLGCHENRDEDNSNNDKNHQTATSKSSSPGISGILGTCRNPTPDTSTLHFSFSPLSVSTVQRFELGSHFVLTTWRVCFNWRSHNSLRSISCCETLIRLSHLHSKLDVRFQPKLGHRRLWSDYETFWEGLQTSS